MISCVFSFFFSSRCRPPPRTTPKNPNVPHHLVNNSSGFKYKWTRMPRAIPPSKVDKIASRLARDIGANLFFLTPGGASFLCFFSFPLAPLSHHLYQLSHHLYRQRLATGRSIGRSIARSIGRSLGRSIARSLGRSLDRSVARSLGRSIARSLGRSFGLSIARLFDRSLGRSIA